MRNMSGLLKAPFPWFGGKSRVAHLVWERFGEVPNCVRPFFGRGAVLLGRPYPVRLETANDKEGMLANFWRAIQFQPRVVASWADWPVNETDLHARHRWLVQQIPRVTRKLKQDPCWCDPVVAGWWVW